MAIEFGYDVATAPSAAEVAADLKEIGGSFVFAYVGGPDSGGSGYSPELIREWQKPFCPIFVPQQDGFVNGAQDGASAAALASAYGAHTVALDCENDAYTAGGRAGWSYIGEMINTLHSRGIKVMVYSSSSVLTAMVRNGGLRPDWLWVASWFSGENKDQIEWAAETVNGHSSISVEGFSQIDIPVGAWQYKQQDVNGRTVDLDAANPAVLSGEITGVVVETPQTSTAVAKAHLQTIRGEIETHVNAILPLLNQMSTIEGTL